MNYPGGIKARKISETKQNISYKNRGMNLEDDLNTTNNYYREKGIADDSRMIIDMRSR